VLPLEAVLRVWDTLLFEMESSVLFRVAAAIVDQNARALLAQSDSVELWARLQRMPSMCFDSSALVDVALLQYSHVTRHALLCPHIRAFFSCQPIPLPPFTERSSTRSAQCTGQPCAR